jgi:GTP cyclohydrolase I
MNQDKMKQIEALVKELILCIGDDPEREGLLKTPERVAKAYAYLFGGYERNPEEFNVQFTEAYDEVVVLRGVEFFSFCEHHILPFYGVASIGYIPNKKVLGLSKLARIVDLYARRLQVQERMTQQIGEAINQMLSPAGVAVVIEGVHSCMTMRGVAKQRSRMTTSVMLGKFRDNDAARAEVLQLLRSKGDHE